MARTMSVSLQLPLLVCCKAHARQLKWRCVAVRCSVLQCVAVMLVGTSHGPGDERLTATALARVLHGACATVEMEVSCSVLNCVAVCCSVLKCEEIFAGLSRGSDDKCLSATHCNTLQHTATHLDTLQHTATHCNWRPVSHCNCYCVAGGACGS